MPVGFLSHPSDSLLKTRTFNAFVILFAISLWIVKTSDKSRSYSRAQRCSSVDASISWAVIRILLPDLRTLPSRMVPTPSSPQISEIGFLVALYRAIDVLAITPSPAILESLEISSSVIPSAKYSSAGSALMFAKGNTAIRALSGGLGRSAFSRSHGITSLYTSTGVLTFFRARTPMLFNGNSILF